MDFWQKMGAAVGLGACTVRIELSQGEVCWGEALAGTLHLEGGAVSQTVESLHASLIEHWTTTTMVGKTPVTQHHYRTHASAVLASGLLIEPGAARSFSWSLVLPPATTLQHHWFAGGQAKIPAAVDRGAQQDFRALPYRTVIALADEVERVSTLRVRSWSLHKKGVVGDLRPSGETAKVLDGAHLLVREYHPRLRGELTINPQERSLADVLKSLALADRQRFPFDLAPGEPLTREFFETSFRPHTDALRELPIASVPPPADPASLPGAAASPTPAPEALPIPDPAPQP